jgi:hypothetical protein
MGCEDCKANDRFTFDSAMAMAERTIKRLWIAVILLIVLFVGTNAAWIFYESQFKDIEYCLEQESNVDGDGVALNANGEVTYYGGMGETDSKN